MVLAASIYVLWRERNSRIFAMSIKGIDIDCVFFIISGLSFGFLGAVAGSCSVIKISTPILVFSSLVLFFTFRELDIIRPLTCWYSCNGLVLLDLDHCKLVLWNPSTGAYKELPCSFHNAYYYFGLCYDSSIDDYKVVLISMIGDKNHPFKFIYLVFSLKGNSWTEPRKFRHFVYGGEIGINVNGMFHLKVKPSFEYHGGREFRIVFFDPVNENFKMVPVPPACRSKGDRFRLIDVKGCLGLYCNTYNGDDGHQVVVWVMNNHHP
ncbi:F-box/kelch-repeat protein At3g06240-like [Cornus florida]|uniref:F-box/kelch-repeat protein At3g06240-like n=1 Tax=Cornus florida TaxID=4283 RepID=UPI0028968826|nr:F-box/kelch-repeat protein At3g06240-like [Cornus florida]